MSIFKFYYITPNMSNYLENILVLGNGPSFTKIDYNMLPQSFKVMRCNTFYLEDKYYAGKQVDYYLFYALCIDEMYFNLRAVHAKKEYNVDLINGIYATVMSEQNKHFPTVKMATPLIQQNPAIAEFRCFYEYYYEQYVPTGLQAIALAAVLGFKNIFLTGFDMFADSNDFMHPFDKNKESQDMFKWSLDRHPMQVQIDFITLLRKEFSNQNFYSVSPESPLNKIVPLAPKNIAAPPRFLPQEKDMDRTLNLLTPPELCKDKNRDFK
jgi:alpha-2,3 sialyltransferase